MVAVQGAKPAEVVVQITRGNAVKAVQPLLETAVVGVDVLDMDGAVDAHARAQIDRLVRELCGHTRLSAIGTGQHAFRRHERIDDYRRLTAFSDEARLDLRGNA